MSLIVASLNVDSIVSFNRRNELAKFLKENRVEVCLIQETKLDCNVKFKIDGYNTMRNDYRRGQHGTAILVALPYNISSHLVFNNKIKSNSVDIVFGGQKRRFTSVYFPPSVQISLEEMNDFFSLQNSSFIGGDFNARMVSFGDVSDNMHGINLVKISKSLGFAILNPPKPTCYRSVNGSFIDKFINNFGDISCEMITVLPTFSDHAAILTRIDGLNSISIKKAIRYDFDHTNIGGLNKFLETKTAEIILPTNENMTKSRMNGVVSRYNDILSEAIQLFVPKAKTHSGSNIVLSKCTRALQASCKNLQRKLYRNQMASLHTRGILINQIKLQKIIVRNAVAFDTANFFSNKYKNVESLRDAFGVIKKFSGHKKRVPMGGSIFTDENKNTPIVGARNIANALGELFVSNNSLPSSMISPMDGIVRRDNRYLDTVNSNIKFSNQISAKIETRVEAVDCNKLLPFHQQNILTSAEEVQDIINKRPNKKSTGRDNLPFTIIKQFSASNILFLTILFNHLIALACFPDEWKNALVTAIPKAGKDLDVIMNWRPISQLPCLAKIFEKIIALRLNVRIQKLGLFGNQYGFLAGNSCTHALARVQDAINHGLNNGKLTTIIALDLKAAFDVMWHDGLTYKMNKLGFGPCLVKLIKSFLVGRSFSVVMDGFTTSPFHMKDGSPQGSVLSPILFNIHVHDIPVNKFAQCTQYADDTTIHLTHDNPGWAQNILNGYLVEMVNYFKKWKLLLSKNKTELINIVGLVKDTNVRLRKRAREMKIVLNDGLLPFSKTIKLLGVQFQANNLFTNNVKLRLEKARRAKFAIERIMKNSYIDTKIKVNIYKSYLRSIITHGAPMWCQPPHVSSHQMEKIRIFERACLRRAVNIKRPIGSFKHIRVSEIYEKSGIVCIDRFITGLHFNFYKKCLQMRNAKFKYNRYGGTGKRYKPIYYIHKLISKDKLLRNGILTLFHERYNGRGGLVYNHSA